MCKIISDGSGQHECLTHGKEFRSATIPTLCPTARKFAKAGRPALPAKYAHLAPFATAPLGDEIKAGVRVAISGGRGWITSGELIGTDERSKNPHYSYPFAVILDERTNEYKEFYYGGGMGGTHFITTAQGAK